LLADALAFHKDQRLEQQIILPCLALDVVNGLSVLYIRIESKDGHRFIGRMRSFL
jgi:hypothetical protein